MPIPTWLPYALLTYLISAVFYFQIQRSGGINDPGFNRRFRLVMWIPGLVALGFRYGTGVGFQDIEYGLGNWPLLILAVFLPLVVELIVIVVALVLKWGAVPKEILKIEGDMVVIGEDFGLLMDEQRQRFPKFILNVLASILIGALFSAFFTFGEEFGWRGYLQSLTMDAYGIIPGLVLVGLVWGFWYFPLVLMGFQFPRNRRLGAFLLMPLTTITLSLVAGWLYLAAESIWAPTLLHAGWLTSSDLSQVGLGHGGSKLRVRLLWMGAWLVIALLLVVG